jgi:hypothetical protein
VSGAVYVGQDSPHTITVSVRSSSAAVDLSATASADVVVTRSDDSTVTWTAQPVSSVSASGFTVTRTLLSSDLTVAGGYRLYVIANASGWESETVQFTVFSR